MAITILRPGQHIAQLGNDSMQFYAPKAAAGALVQDLFTDTNGVSLQNHTPDVDAVGGGWVIGRGPWTININMAIANYAASAANPYYHAYIETNQADVIIESTLFVKSEPRFVGGACFRHTGYNDFWFVSVQQDSGVFRLVERTAGTELIRDSNVAAIGAGNHTLRIELSGTAISATLDGGRTLSTVSAVRQAATQHGMIERRGNRCPTDDIEITAN